ncbi:tyrosine-type recombinase/integrase [Psychrobacillus lasiicapitis]|uniref:Phage integrase family protein n=1 Tax=Psychrobacillus lasiicapitis TaxID=1636719 RepID=A0A544T1W8_9BACI|nr:tyrosine-type recombinase/integrase [Psychrobacillus lasiicapitis]TQR11431.1 phage integrase family protein [Psychrobacillus lasiicapitis]GGA40596.1 hypothetical protein GCM10011384_32800 [Psychrobacillus lasiicapitis]
MKKLNYDETINNEITTVNIKKNSKRRIKRIEEPPYLNEYSDYLKTRNYSASTIGTCLTRTKQFSSQIKELFEKDFSSLEGFGNLDLIDIDVYENFLIERVRKNEIKNETAYNCIKNFRLFLQFLKYKEIIDYKYSIPKKFMVTPSQINVVIPKEITLKMCDSILKNPNMFHRYRNLAVLLVLVNTGCRPLEISNLKINDLNTTERKITLNSIKSSQRTLNLNQTVILILKKYLIARDSLMPQTDDLFLKRNGKPISPQNITSILHAINTKVFGESIANARSYRHSYITNAIEDRNDFKEISEAVGHKHWFSTQHYLHRSKQRLLNNTLQFDPTENLFKEYEYGKEN